MTSDSSDSRKYQICIFVCLYVCMSVFGLDGVLVKADNNLTFYGGWYSEKYHGISRVIIAIDAIMWLSFT